MTQISVSILGSDLANIADTIKKLENSGADKIHLDVMDGAFVPNITFGQEVIKSMRPYSTLEFDTHLMIQNPENHLDAFIDSGVEAITFHLEATKSPETVITKLSSNDILAGIAMKPSTKVDDIFPWLAKIDRALVMSVDPGFAGQKFIESTYDKITELRQYISANKLKTQIYVDGGVNLDNCQKIVGAGADVLVAASAILKNDDYEKNIGEFRRRIS